MSEDGRKDYGPTGCVNRSFGLLLVLAGLVWAFVGRPARRARRSS